MGKLTDSDLKALLAAEKADALASEHSSKLSSERSRALDYYMGDITDDVPNVPGRSSATSSDVADTVEGLMPSLMEIFAGSDDAIRFEPIGPEDIEAAEQETEYVKHVFWNRNDGFNVLYCMIKDALLCKLGVAKVWWEEEERDTRETYYDQSDDQLMMIVADQGIEVVEHSSRPDDYAGQMMDPMQQGAMPPPMVHDVTVVRKETYASAKVEAVPPEEFGIARRARNVSDSHYCFHEPSGGRPAADLIAEGYDKKQIDTLPTYTHTDSFERFARDTADESSGPWGDDGINKAMRPIRITEHYVRMDYKGDGKAKLYRVVTGGEDSTVLKRDGKPDIEEWDFMPFAVMTPIIMPHRVYGRSVADVVMDIQRQKSVVLRGLLDNVYAANNPRPVVNETNAGDTTLDDLSVSRHGSAVRVKNPGAVEWLQVPSIVNHVFPVLQYLDAEREWRTGVTRQGQGLDADVLTNQTATAAQQGFNAAQARMKLIARVFAETGIKDMFWILHAIIRKHANKAETVRLLNKWVPVDPRNWKDRNDITVCVGLGQGGKAERLQQQMVVANLQKEIIEGGGYNALVTAKNMYNNFREISNIIEKDAELFFTDPGDEPVDKPPSAEEKKADAEIERGKMDAQMKMAELQARMQELQAKADIERLQAEADVATNDRKIQADMALAERKFQFDAQLKQQEFELEREMKMYELGAKQQQYQMDMDKTVTTHELDVEKAEMGLQTQAESAAIDQQGKVADQERKAKADKAKMKQEAPISGALKKMQEQQALQAEQMAKVLEAVESEREIEIKRDSKGKAAGAVSRRKKK
jgi:hypothetical protein